MCPGEEERLPFEPSPHKDEIVQALREGDAQGINPSELIAGVSVATFTLVDL